MRKHKQTGNKGEALAAQFLKEQGYEIVEKNWRYGQKEVDIIARMGNELVIVEVKTRSSFDYGFPEESVSLTKQAYLKIAAEAYYETLNDEPTIRFDIISLLTINGVVKECVHFKDAFY